MSSIREWPVFRGADRALSVRSAQYLLGASGHEITIDGIFGPQTEAAVTAYQKGRGLAVDGVIGPETWQALIVTVSQGSQGEPVYAVQEQLRTRVMTGNPDMSVQVDGLFGQRTDEVVRIFQQRVGQSVDGFAVDGVVGPQTWQAVIGGMLFT